MRRTRIGNVLTLGVLCRFCSGSVKVKVKPDDLQVPSGGKICFSAPTFNEFFCSEPLPDPFQEVEIVVDTSQLRYIEAVSIDHFLLGQDSAGQTTGASQVDLKPKGCTLNILGIDDMSTLVGLEGIQIRYELLGCSIPEDGEVRVDQHKSDAVFFILNSGCSRRMFGCVGVIFLQQLKYATHGIELSMVGKNLEKKPLTNWSKSIVLFNVLPKNVEHFLPNEGMQLFGTVPEYLGKLSKRRCRIGFVGNYHLDGQKTIWGSIIKEITLRKDLFEVEYLSFVSDNVTGLHTFSYILDDMNVTRVIEPLFMRGIGKLSVEEATDKLIQGLDSLLKARHMSYAHRCPQTARPANQCSRILMELITFHLPKFAVDLALVLVGTMSGFDVIISLNSKLKSDVFLEQTARLAGATLTVFELPNNEPSKLLKPVVYLAPSWFSHAASSLQDFKTTKSIVIYPGIDLDHFSFDERRWKEKDQNQFTFGIIGRLEPEKIHGLFLDFAEKIVERHPGKRFRFIVIGKGSLERNLRRVVRLKKLEVEFVGHVSYEQLPDVMRELDFSVQLGFSETFCLVNIESISLGIPVIGFGSGAPQEYLVHGLNSFLASQPTLDALLHAGELALALTTPSFRFFASQSVKQFSKTRMTDSYLRVFLEWSGFLQ